MSKHLQLASQVCHNYANLFEVHLFEVRENLQRIVQQRIVFVIDAPEISSFPCFAEYMHVHISPPQTI